MRTPARLNAKCELHAHYSEDLFGNHHSYSVAPSEVLTPNP